MPKISDHLQPSIDIIAVKSFDNFDQFRMEDWIRENFSFDYVATVSFRIDRGLFGWPLNLQLRLCVKKSRFRLPNRDTTLRELGPVWMENSLSDTKNMQAIACDLFVRSNPRSDFIQLRIPNVYSSSIVDPASTGEWMQKLLPSSTQWLIFEDKGEDDESAIDQSDGLANLREVPLEVLIYVTRGEEEGGGERGEGRGGRGRGGEGRGEAGGGEGGGEEEEEEEEEEKTQQRSLLTISIS